MPSIPKGDFKKPEIEHETYYHIFHSMSDAAFIADSETGFIIDANRQAEVLLCKNLDEIIGLHQRELHPPEISNKKEPVFKDATEKDFSYNIESEVLRKDGSVIPVSINTSAMNIKGHKIILGIFRDISYQKKVENNLMERNEELEKFFAVTMDLFCIADTEGYFRMLNNSWERTLGYSLEELKDSKFLDLVHPDDMENTINAMADLKEQKKIFNFVNRYRHKNGTYRWLEWNSYPSGNKIYASTRDITESKIAQEELKRSESLFRGYFELPLIAIAIISLEKRWLKVNDKLCELVGYSREELETLTFNDITHPEDREKGVKVYDRILGGEADDYTYEKRYIKKDGNIVPVFVSSRVVRKSDGTPDFFVAIIQDITDRKRAEEELRKSEERFRTIIEFLPFPVSIVDGGQNTEYINKAFTDVLGYNIEDIPDTLTWFNLAYPDPDYRREVIARWQRDVANNKENNLITHTFKVKCKDGTFKYITFRVRNLEKDRQVVLFEDITERKKSEELLNQKIIALTQPAGDISNITFQDLFDIDEIQKIQDVFADATGVASIITEVDGTPITKPSNFCRLCMDIIRKTPKGRANCYHSDAVIGKCNLSGPIVQPCLSGSLLDAGAGIRVGERHIANWLIGQVIDDEFDLNKMMAYAKEIEADENEYYSALKEVKKMPKEQFRKVAEALFLIANQLSLLALQNIQQARDITYRKQSEEIIKNQLSELEVKNAELERFTYTVSHDLKSPLITIKGFLGHLVLDAKSGKFERMESDIKRISNAADKMETLLKDLLELSRIGRIVNPSTEFSMSSVVKEAYELLYINIKDKGIDISYDEHMPHIYGDKVRIREVWQNLMENAIKYIGNQAVPFIKIGYIKADENIIFFIKDNGIGIENKYHNKIFELFEKLDIKTEGTGIGLALVKRIIEFHGGRIWVESEGKDKGSAFYFTIKGKI